ncbi:hypothetical protein [Planobispora rosea]|nr:hypothetical protein [Planobispora rosea]
MTEFLFQLSFLAAAPVLTILLSPIAFPLYLALRVGQGRPRTAP